MAAKKLLLVCLVSDRKACAVMSNLLGNRLKRRGIHSLFPFSGTTSIKYGIMRRGYATRGREPEPLSDPSIEILYTNPSVGACEVMRLVGYCDEQAVFIASADASQAAEMRRQGYDLKSGYVLFDGTAGAAPFVDFSRSIILTQGEGWNRGLAEEIADLILSKFLFDEVSGPGNPVFCSAAEDCQIVPSTGLPSYG